MKSRRWARLVLHRGLMTTIDAPTGPDFAQGVSVDAVRDGEMVLGHVGGQPALLARRGIELFVIGSKCSHYGGPLGQGVTVGETVRCPWHHACFNLATGAAIGAPALDPVPAWRVVRRDGKAFATTRVEPPAPLLADGPGAVVIVGAGAAGCAAAETLRREGYMGPVTLVGDDPSDPVDRPNLSKDYLAGTAPAEWIPLRDPAFFSERRIELVRDMRATAVDVRCRAISLADGRSLPFGALLLATGAAPVRLTIPGADLPHVLALRSFGDARAIAARAGRARRAVVLGASFLGLEVAASLRELGLEVHVAAPEARPLATVLGAAVGDFVRTLHEAHGVVFHLQSAATSIDPLSVSLTSGERIGADLVIQAVGVRPAFALAEAAGIAVDGGIVVDEYLQTRFAGIYAAGDVARYPDPHSGHAMRVEHWVAAQRQGQTAARNMLGRQVRFLDVPFFWSAHYDVTINYVGHAPSWDRMDIAGDLGARDAAIAYRAGGRTLAVATIGRDRASLEAELALEHGDELALARLVPPSRSARRLETPATIGRHLVSWWHPLYGWTRRS